MGEELKTDVGSAEERDQATERRQQEIQEETVGAERVAECTFKPFTPAARQISTTLMGRV